MGELDSMHDPLGDLLTIVEGQTSGWLRVRHFHQESDTKEEEAGN